MSITNRHSVVPFTAGESKPMTGQRLAKVGYKSTKKNPARFKSVCVSVPEIPENNIRSELDRLIPHVRTMLENAQDGIIRSLYESREGNLSEVSDDEISVLSCIAFMDAEAAGDRLKKEHIENWFDAELSDSLFVLIAEKLGFNEPTENQTAEVQKHVRVYRQVLSMLAGGKTLLQPKQIQGCKTALALTDTDQGIGQKLLKRLEQMEKPVQIAELLDL